MAQPTKRARRSYAVYVDAAVCDGCEICIFLCKPVVFELSREINRRGVYPALPVRGEQCTNCRLCQVGCPQLAIAVCPVAGDTKPGVDPAPEGTQP